MKCCRKAEEIKYFRFAPLAGSRFNALRIHEWGKRPGIENMPGLPFTNHSPRRSGRSSALPYPPGEQNDVNKLREWHQQEWRFDLSVAVKRNSRFHLKFVTSWFKNGGKPRRPGKDARLVIGAVIIKHKLNLSDEEAVLQIQENPYLQYFVGFSSYKGRTALH